MRPKMLYEGFVTVVRAANGHEVVRTTNAVAMLVHDVDGRRMIFVEQNRPAMRETHNPTGKIVEVPAGRFDDPRLSIYAVIMKELDEEIGVTARQCNIQIVNSGNSLATSPGVLTERVLLAYVRVRSHQIHKGEWFGNAAEGERTRRVFVPVDKLHTAPLYDIKTFALVQWFLRNVYQKESR